MLEVNSEENLLTWHCLAPGTVSNDCRLPAVTTVGGGGGGVVGGVAGGGRLPPSSR